MSKSGNPSEIEKLTILNTELENYFRNTIIPQMFVDANLILRKFTPPAMRQFDLKMEDIGKHIEKISHHIRFPTFIENIHEVIETGNDLEKEIQTTDMRWFQMNILPYKVYNENRNNGVIITFVNITDRIKNLKEIEALNADHETFIYSVSHDLKGPLSNLQALMGVLNQVTEVSSIECKKVVSMVNVSVEDLTKIINELTDLTRTRHNFTKEAERVNIENILEEVQLTLKERIKNSSAKISTEINISEINFIRKNLRSVIYNLMSNAIKFKSPDRDLKIFVKTEKLEKYNVLSVEDNGIGIEKSSQQSIFEEFSRISKDVEGSGVGLFIVKKMIENAGGKIEVESKIGQGTTFKVYFRGTSNNH